MDELNNYRAYMQLFNPSTRGADVDNDSNEAPPPYEYDQRTRLQENESKEQPPEYDDTARSPSAAQRDAKPNDEGTDDMQIPETALYLLGTGGDSIRQRVFDDRPSPPDPAIWEFELVCLACFSYESECACTSGDPVTSVRPDAIPKVKMPNRTFPYPACLPKEVKNRTSSHVASAIAHTMWPEICQGTIPIFNENCLVAIRSRALDHATSPKDILHRLRKPITRSPSQNCSCCGNLICEKFYPQSNLRELENAHRASSTTTYTLRGRTFSVVRTAFGKSYFNLKELGTFEMETSEEDDFLFYCCILPTFGMSRTYAKTKHPSSLNWDRMLQSLLQETLMCENDRLTRFETLPVRSFSYRERLHAVFRSENFGTGPGFLVMDWPLPRSFSPKKIRESSYSLSYVASINRPQLSKNGFMSESPSARPQPGDPSSPGQGWDGIFLELKAQDQLYLKKKTKGLFKDDKTAIGCPKQPLSGHMCSGKCKERKGKDISVHVAGFAPPSLDNGETTVYILGKEAIPWLVVSQYAMSRPDKPLFFLNKNHCLGCTVLETPTGSTIAAHLPSSNIWEGYDITTRVS